jgi:hypothetical protein
MKNYTKGKCMLDAIFIIDFCKQGAPLNWCKYFLTEMLHDYADVHEKVGYFIYNYLLVTFTMWKWRSPQGRELAMIPDS